MLNKIVQFILLILFIFSNNTYSNNIENSTIFASPWSSGFHQEILPWPFAHVDPSEDWLECNGQNIDPIKYPKLYEIMETTPNYNNSFFMFSTGHKANGATNAIVSNWERINAGPNKDKHYFREWRIIPWSQFPKSQSLWISDYRQYMDELDYYRYEPFYFYSNNIAINNSSFEYWDEVYGGLFNQLRKEQKKELHWKRFNANYTNFDNENLSDLLKNEKQYKIQNQVGNGGSFFSFINNDFIIFNSWGKTQLGYHKYQFVAPFHFKMSSSSDFLYVLKNSIDAYSHRPTTLYHINEHYNFYASKNSLRSKNYNASPVQIIADYHSGSDYTLPKFVRVRYFIRAK